MSSESTMQTRSKRRKTDTQQCEQTLQLSLQSGNSKDGVIPGDENNIQTSRMADEFKVLTAIGSGGFGTVFKCERKADNSLYAIKIVPFESKKRKTVFKELKFLSQLNSKFVVKYINSWVEEYYTEIVEYNNNILENISSNNPLNNPNLTTHLLNIQMELCALTLRDVIKMIIKCERLSLIGYYISSELFKEIVECVQYIHSQKPPIIHRDLKPENFLITFSNKRFVKLSDFGLSTFHEFYDQSHTAGNVGTTQYIAPEVINLLANTSKGKPKAKYTTKADCYSLGIILQELFYSDISFNKVTQRKYLLLLDEKMDHIEDLLEKLHAYSPKKRPKCDAMLKEFELLRLTDSEIKIDKRFMKIVNNSSNSYSIDNQFIEFFVHNKYKFSARPVERQNKERFFNSILEFHDSHSDSD